MNLPRRKFLHLNAAAALALVFQASYAKEGWPTHSVQLLVGYAPDNGLNSIAQVLADRLSEIWSQQVIVENNLATTPELGSMQSHMRYLMAILF
jgi:tripartite-type tricarboxylate transporter receptor subunit TctC